jgi:hypothetical protein
MVLRRMLYGLLQLKVSWIITAYNLPCVLMIGSAKIRFFYYKTTLTNESMDQEACFCVIAMVFFVIS